MIQGYIRVRVYKDPVHKSGKAAKTGKDYSMYEHRVNFALGEDDAPKMAKMSFNAPLEPGYYDVPVYGAAGEWERADARFDTRNPIRVEAL
jgi:hypothetical protein